MARSLQFLTIATLLLCCTKPDDSINRFADPHLLKIADFQDRRLADSLYRYFNHPEAAYRREAVEAFGSLQDTSYIDRIGKLLLMDPDASVRQAAAFALGQVAHPTSERVLLGAVVKEKDPEAVAEILEAYGKTARLWNVEGAKFMDDSVKTAGLAWSLYRAGLRGKTDGDNNAVAVRLLDPSRSAGTRLGAAHYFARGARDFQAAEPALRRAAAEDILPEVRMAAVLALGKTETDSALLAIKEVIKSDDDARVVINAIRALKNFPYNEVKHYLYEALRHEEVNVGIAASETIIESLAPEDWIEVSNVAGQVDSWRIKANLYKAALKAGGNEDVAAEIMARYTKTSDPYERAAWLASLGHYPQAHEFVATALKEADTAVVRSTAAGTLAAMSRVENVSPSVTRRFASLFADIIRTTEDPAVVGSLAAALADSAAGFRNHVSDAAFLHAAREKLSLPEDHEALLAVEGSIAYLEQREPAPVVNDFNHPIDWELVKRIPRDQTAVIKTARGSIVIRLLVDETPGTVGNFVALAMRDYFDGLILHRVVPNFVIQDGCKRGDGWGSEDYSIRSEFTTRPYRTGSVGMASAGKDTEGTQWFITHSPTPHLEGRYTQFAEVIEGQRVVDLLQVGDKIYDVEIENFTDQ